MLRRCFIIIELLMKGKKRRPKMASAIKTITICFPDGKNKVLTMSYDDGRQEDRRLVELFNRYAIKGTFHLNSGIDWDARLIPTSEYQTLYQGHEIACHGYTHLNLAQAPMEQVVTQVLEDRRALEAITGYPVKGMSYPFAAYNESVKSALKVLGIKYSRIVSYNSYFNMPEDYYEWKPTCHHEQNLLELAKQFAGIDNKYHLYMMYVWGHSYEFTDETKWKVIEDFCSYIGNRSDIWYATNIQIVDYMEAAKRLEFAADSSFVYNPSIQTVWINASDDVIEIPGGHQVFLK